MGCRVGRLLACRALESTMIPSDDMLGSKVFSQNVEVIAHHST